MKKIVTLVAAFLLYFNAFAQLTQVGTPEFDNLFTVTAQEDSLYKKDGTVGLIYSFTREYKFNIEGKFELVQTIHKANKLYDDVKVNELKKLEFSESIAKNLITCDGQLIRDGKVLRKLTKKDLISIEPSDADEEEAEEEAEEDSENNKKTMNQALIFEEAQPGDIIEFFFIRKMPSVPESGRYSLQDEYASKNVMFQLIMPSHLKADLRVYNADEVASDSINEREKKRYTTVYIPFVKGVKIESHSFRLPNLVCVDYVLAFNYGARKQRFNTISDFGLSLYNMNNTLSKGDKKALKKIKTNFKVDKSMSEEEKIRTIERGIKENYAYINLYFDILSSIEGIQSFGFGNTLAFLRLYYQLFTQNGIAHEIVATSDRTRLTFDPDFDTRSNLDEYLFYFPKIDMYMSPTDKTLRLGLIPEKVIGQYAVFYEPTTMGSVTTYLHSIKELPILPIELTGDTLKVSVTVDPIQERVSSHVYRSITGYNSPFLQANFNNLTAEGKEFMLNHYLALDDDNNIVKNESYRNYESEDVGVKPFIMEADFTSANLTSQTQNGFELHVGKLIGTQGEFKQEGERQLPIENMNKHHYYRVITIEIPQGYTCVNLADFNYAVYNRGDQKASDAGFTVEAEQNGNTITLICIEYYDSIYYPAYEHVGYGKVINAAFDFNKNKLEFVKKD